MCARLCLCLLLCLRVCLSLFRAEYDFLTLPLSLATPGISAYRLCIFEINFIVYVCVRARACMFVCVCSFVCSCVCVCLCECMCEFACVCLFECLCIIIPERGVFFNLINI